MTQDNKWQALVDELRAGAATDGERCALCSHRITSHHVEYDEGCLVTACKCGKFQPTETDSLSAPWADHPECDHLMKWGTHDENGCSLCSCLTVAMSKPVGHEALEAMREIVSYLRSEYSAGRFPVPEHYVDTVEAALSTPAVEPANRGK